MLHNMRGERMLKITDYSRKYFTFSGFVENQNYLQICDRLLHTKYKSECNGKQSEGKLRAQRKWVNECEGEAEHRMHISIKLKA